MTQQVDDRFVSVHNGNDSLLEFYRAMNSYFDEDAVGKVYTATYEDFALKLMPLTGCAAESLVRHQNEGFEHLDAYEMIIVDSGNKHGDSWKSVFYPKIRVLTFIRQN